MRAFVTGCTGYIGRHLVKRLIDDGHFVRVLIRKDCDVKEYQDLGTDVHLGDITKIETLEGIEKDIDVVFHLACVFLGSNYKNVVVQGTKNLISIFKNKEIKSFIYELGIKTTPNLSSHKCDI